MSLGEKMLFAKGVIDIGGHSRGGVRGSLVSFNGGVAIAWVCGFGT
jgi:hypothetical protein